MYKGYRVVDSHVHIGSFPVLEHLPRSLTTKADIVGFRTSHPHLFALQHEQEPVDNSDRLVAALDNRGIEKAIVMARPGVSNDQVAAMAARHPGRLYPQLRLGSEQQLSGYAPDPSDYRRRAPEEITRAVEELGMIGVGEVFVRALTRSIHPEEIADDLQEIMETVIRCGIPIAFPTGWSQWKGGLHYGDPLWVDEVAGRHPEARILLTKMGRGLTGMFENTMAVAQRNANIYLDMTHTRTDHLVDAVKLIGSNRILYGSDWSATWQYLSSPHDTHSLGFEVVLEAQLSSEDTQNIFAVAAEGLFGVPTG